jgi:hypothetical protein
VDALLHGCIPVVVEDDIAPPLANMLQLKDVTVAIPRSDLRDLPKRLLEIPQEEADAMRHRISQGLWRRMAWLTHPMVRYQAQTVLQGNEQKYPWLKEQRQEELLRFFHGGSSSSSGGGQAEPPAGGTTVAADGTLQPIAAAEGAEGGGVEDGDGAASLLPPIWWPREPEDDAFGTLLGWLHHLLLQRKQQQPSKAGQQQQQQQRGGGATTQQTAQPAPVKQHRQHKRQRQKARVE